MGRATAVSAHVSLASHDASRLANAAPQPSHSTTVSGDAQRSPALGSLGTCWPMLAQEARWGSPRVAATAIRLGGGIVVTHDPVHLRRLTAGAAKVPILEI